MLENPRHRRTTPGEENDSTDRSRFTTQSTTPIDISEKISVGDGGKHKIAFLLRANRQSPILRSAPGSPSLSVASYGSTTSSSDLLATASSALRRLHFKSSSQNRMPKYNQNIAKAAAAPILNSHSISTDSSATMNTSTDSANTQTTLVTLTDNGEHDSLDLPVDEKVVDSNSKTPMLAADKEEDFYSASSTDDQNLQKSSEDLNVIFPKEDILLEEYDDSIQPLLQHTTIPKPDEAYGLLEDSKLPATMDGDPCSEWYNIKMRQQKVSAAQKQALQARRRQKFLSKRYSKCYFEEERTRNDKGRNSSGFAAEQMTIDSEDSFAWDSSSLASPPAPTSPTGSITPTDSEQPLLARTSPSKKKPHFTFPPMTDANDLVNEYKIKVNKQRRQSQVNAAKQMGIGPKETVNSGGGGSGGGELITKKLRIEGATATVMTSQKREEERTINKAVRNNGNESGVATIVVQQPSVTGNSPEQSCDKCDISVNNARRSSNVFGDVSVDKNAVNYSSASIQRDNNMKQMLDVTNTTLLHQWQDIDSKYSSHHNRSQSVRAPGSKSTVQVGINGTSRYRPNYLCLPQQRTRVASMPNTGVEEEYYRLRQFSISGKGSIINRGDSLKSRRSRSNTSVASSNSSHSTEQVTVCGTTGAVLSGGGCSGNTSAAPSLPSSRESSCASCPGITPPFRVVMLGSNGVGKSSLVSQFMTSEYLQATGISIDEDFGEKSVCISLDGEEFEIIFIDQPSSKISPPVDLSNYESPHGYCVVYSTSDRESFQQAETYLQALWRSDSIRSKAVILVGNKTDLVRIRAVSTEEGSNKATSYDCKFCETSVGINHNVDELLVGLLTQIRLKLDNPPDPSIPRDQYNTKKRSRSPLGNCGPRIYRGSRTSASLRVRKILSKVWSINSKSKSCENLHIL